MDRLDWLCFVAKIAIRHDTVMSRAFLEACGVDPALVDFKRKRTYRDDIMELVRNANPRPL